MTGIYDQLSLFRGLGPGQLALVQRMFIKEHAVAGTVLFEQGDLAEYLYVLVAGEIHIRYKPDDGPAINVARIRPEGVVGWSAVLGNPAYTSSAVCVMDCQMLRVRGQDLRSLCDRHPETGSIVLERLAAMIAERLRNTHQNVRALLEQGMHINGVAGSQAR